LYVVICRRGDSGGKEGIVPLKKLGGRDGGAFISCSIFRKCLANLHCKTDKNERERR